MSHQSPTIITTECGLTIANTRITLDDVMDYVTANYPPQLIQEKLGLNEQQIKAALAYIKSHRAEVEADYQNYLQTAAEIYQYWEERNRDRFAKIATMPPKIEQEALRRKLQAWKQRIESQV